MFNFNFKNVLFLNNNYTKTSVKHSYVILYLVNKINNITIMVFLLVTVIFTITLIYPTDTANILAVFPYQGLSHHMVYLPYIQELANQEHNITFISNYPIEHSNINNLSIRGSIPISNNKENISSFERSKNEIIHSINVIRMFNYPGKTYEAIFTVDSVMALLNSPYKFDLLVTEHFNTELFIGFAFKFNIPFILLTSCNLLPWNQHAIGQPYSLATVPSTITSLPIKMNFYSRVMNTISHTVQLFGFKLLCRAKDEAIIKRNLDIEVSLDQIILNASLIMVNTHFTMFSSKPLVPAVVEIGGIHITPIKPLPIVSILFLLSYNNSFDYKFQLNHDVKPIMSLS